jgi:hypothetical protein
MGIFLFEVELTKQSVRVSCSNSQLGNKEWSMVLTWLWHQNGLSRATYFHRSGGKGFLPLQIVACPCLGRCRRESKDRLEWRGRYQEHCDTATLGFLLPAVVF